MAAVHARVALVAVALLAGGCETRGPLDAAESPIDLEPTPQQTWYALGLMLLAASEPARAEKAFQRSLVVEGVSAETMTGAGIAAAQQGMMTAAKRYLERAHRIDPESADVNNTLGAVLFRLGDTASACAAFRTAFIVSSGASETAALHLELCEEMQAGALAGAPEDPAVAFALDRLGQTEFRLRPSDAAPVSDAAVAGVVAPAAGEPGEAAPAVSDEAAGADAPAAPEPAAAAAAPVSDAAEAPAPAAEGAADLASAVAEDAADTPPGGDAGGGAAQ